MCLCQGVKIKVNFRFSFCYNLSEGNFLSSDDKCETVWKCTKIVQIKLLFS